MKIINISPFHWLFKAAADWHCQVHAYVLMTNHVHLLVTPKTNEGLTKLMQSVVRRYVQYVNRFYKRSGTLWEGRFKSNQVQIEDYFLLCQRYIELNPVRACMVNDPAQYRWSCYRHRALGQIPNSTEGGNRVSRKWGIPRHGGKRRSEIFLKSESWANCFTVYKNDAPIP
jgi:REP element-mobilizing transposase RayT